MEVHVVNLDRNPERFESFRENNGHLGSIVRFAAVDGRLISRDQLISRGVFSADAPEYTPGAVGCALSHLSLWKQASEQTGPFTVVEDDALLNQSFEVRATELLQQLPADWDIVLWGWNFDSILLFHLLPTGLPCLTVASEQIFREHLQDFQKLQLNPQTFRLQKAFGTLAYTVSPKGAVKLANHCLPIRPMDVYCAGLNRAVPNFAIDVMANALYQNINAYVSFPPLAVTRNDKSQSTTETSLG
jgi:glycosyl transferase, family 25